MARKKLTNPDDLLNRPLVIRVNEATYARLENIRKESDCHCIGEVARRILSRQRINLFHHDVSLDRPMEELTRIRRELKAIGININQQTHRFHISDSESERAFYVNRTAILYKDVGDKVERLLVMVSQLAEKWLRK
ncbi:hypothetical protein GCM10011386_26670 [Parapedobacter defluvii]|uniref:Mobilization protein n=1 Tax=Parapedobacter defluvii TaxID=2045106 RepID=A0ABQ1M3U3_9SPHI|nr:mobilization protein [Parapedobacter defluvii]GGC33260.1 hypothetical protein GCM10011386_26670 [Parapedobacter defluvii]